MSSATPSATGPPADGEEPPAAPELPTQSRTWNGLDRLGLDRIGLTQAIGGLALGLITLFSSYDHITISGRTFPIPQQWGITFILASVAIFFVDAQLATGSRPGLIQSLSQSPLPKVAACGVLEGIASIPCLNSLLSQLILI